LEATEVIGHNIKFDALWLARKCNVHLVKMFDTSSASRILSNGDSKVGNRLAEVADRYLGIELRKDQGRSDWGALMLLAEQIQYAAQDVEHLHTLKEKLDAELKAAALMGVLRLEMDLLPVVIGMELIGFCVDRKKLEELAAKATQERDQVAQTVHNLLGTGDVNLNVPAQFLKALQGLGIALKNTNEDSLSECRHPVADAILEYRKWKKLKEDVESCIHEIRSDGRIHGQFNPLGTDTGRFSSSEPNMQHIRRRELRPPLWHQSGMFWLPGDGRKGSGNRRCDIGKQAGPECQPRTRSLLHPLRKPRHLSNREFLHLRKRTWYWNQFGDSRGTRARLL
jgi:DNA polymerase I-like protein with 3'-5' exonuclease and polymerase domains